MNIYFKNLKLFSFKIILTLFFIIIFIPCPAFAEVSLSASVDRTKVALGEEISLSLIVEDGGSVSDPELPQSQDFTSYFKGTSSQTQIINGNMSNSYTYNYSLIFNKIGQITIPAISMMLNGKKYITEPINIEVTETPSSTELDKSKSLFVLAQVNKKNPYVNEQVIYTFKFYTKVQTDLFQKTFPDFKGFWVDDIGKDNIYFQVINGQRYKILEVNKAIYPTKSGVIEIKPTNFLVEVIYEDNNMSIFSSTRKEVQKFATASIKLNVKDLPPAPSGFSGIVSNNLTIKSNLIGNNIKAGESANLEIALNGTGNINDFKKINLNIPDIKIYDDKPLEKSDTTGNKLSWNKNFKYSLIPLKKGEIKINPIEIIYFNPTKKQYQTVKTQAYKIFSESAEKIIDKNTQQNDSKANSEKEKIDIKGIFKNNDLSDQKISTNLLVFFEVIFGISLIILGYIYFLKNKINFSKISTKSNNKNLIKKIDSENSLENMYILLKDYLNYKFSITNLNEENIKNKVNDNLIAEQLIKVVKEYNYIKFSGNSNSSKEKEIIDDTKKIIKVVEAKK